MDPLLKWPGGKRKLLTHVVPLLPTTYCRYIEPFFGGGALFFHLLPKRALLCDLNERLIECYLAVRDRPHKVIDALRRLKNTEENYYEIRSSRRYTPHTRAAKLIYLCSLSFNGIYRENLLGTFNVPYGYKTNNVVFDPNQVLRASDALASATILVGDFETATSAAASGDMIYVDPPYTVTHGNNGFVKYNSRIFSWNDQMRLARECRRLATLGCHTIISNAAHHEIRALYRGFKILTIARPSVMAASSGARRTVEEFLVVSRST
jgi:DNA adenine methylase